jgi:hypothetical protein
MTDEFAAPAVPKADNSTGPPTPPSGHHPMNPAPTVIIKAGDGLPRVPAGAGSNIQGSPSGSHTGEG